MKYQLKLLLTVAVLSCLSCQKLLDTKPTDFLSPETYFTTKEQANTALNGVYSVLGDESSNFFHNPTNLVDGNDESYFPRVAQTTGLAVNTISAEHTDVNVLWKGIYDGVNRANVLINALQRSSIADQDKNPILGQALTLRAFFYFWLVINWGDVPLKLDPTTSVNSVDLARTSSPEVYAQIVKDLEQAEPLVQSATAIGYGGRINKSAVRGLLARVNLHWAGFPLKNIARYAEARKWSQLVIQSAEHELNPSYSQIFINQCQDKYDIKEIIWEVEFWGNRTDAYLESGRIGSLIGIACQNSTIGVCSDRASTTLKLFDAYKAEPDGSSKDQRRDWAIAPFKYNNATKVNFTTAQKLYRNAGKWRREYEMLTPKNANYTPINYPLIRYSDILLMFAEADNAVNGPTAAALDAVNQVRRRGYAKAIHTPDATVDISGLDQPGLLKAIQDERLRELCFESLRKWDLIRWGIFLDACHQEAANIETNGQSDVKYASFGIKSVADRNLLLPIPSSEITLNKLITQNPGW